MRMKRVLSLTLIFILLLNLMPLGDLNVFASSTRTVRITRTFENINTPRDGHILINDQDISEFQEKLTYVLATETDPETDPGYQLLEDIDSIGGTILQGPISSNIGMFSDVLITDSENNQMRYPGVNIGSIPRIDSIIDPIISPGEDIRIEGSNLDKLINDNTIFKVEVAGLPASVSYDETKEEYVIKPDSGALGVSNITIIYTDEKTSIKNHNEEEPYKLEVRTVYREAVSILGSLDLEGITMFPTMGEVGSEVKFRRSTLGNYDVYFIRDLDTPSLFTEENKVKDTEYEWASRQSEDDTVTIKVPDINSGLYYVVFTNNDSLEEGVNAYKAIGQFRVIPSSGQKPVITSVSPSSTPSMIEQEVDINGHYFSNHNIHGFTRDDNDQPVAHEIKDGKLMFDYGEGTLTIGGVDHRVEVTREITAIIKEQLEVKEFNIDGQSQTITVKTEHHYLDEYEEPSDVVLEMRTYIKPLDDPEFEGDMYTEAILPGGFTYLPATEIPNISEVVPGIVPIEEIGDRYYIHESLDELYIAIHGSNFLVTRYMDENDNERVSLPEITIGGFGNDFQINQQKLEEADSPIISYEVLNNGRVVTGRTNNEIGDTILLRIKAGPEGVEVSNRESRSISIRNPIRQSSTFHHSHPFGDKIEFKQLNTNNFPVISNVHPNIVAIDGGEEIVITGSNFRPNSKVYIENNLVTDINVENTERITFNAPPGSRSGPTQIQVVNIINDEIEGIATYPFIYTTTYTDPKLESINPNIGTKGTIVTAKGEGILRPDPTVSVTDINTLGEAEIYRLMGTRVLLDGHEINRYNRENGHIRLTQYSQGYEGRILKENIFEYRDNIGEIELGLGFNSVILYDEEDNEFYSITRDIRNQFIIRDGRDNNYYIQYNDGFEAIMNGTVYDLEQETKGKLKLTKGEDVHLELTAYTPYLIEVVDGDSIITGNKVQVIDSNNLIFEVPNLVNAPWSGDGYYDVSIVNPDTKRATLPEAFEYLDDPRIIPVVEDINPYIGPEKGGNIITITSPGEGGFFKSGETQTQVFIGSQKVPEEDVFIKNPREMTVVVPAYPESIKDKGTDRVTVPIVLVNYDGGSFDIHNDNPLIVDREGKDIAIRGYTYVVPTSNPIIEDYFPKEGPAKGGNIVRLIGRDFRKSDEGSLPIVHFGNEEAEIIEDTFSSGLIQVIAPPGQGIVDIYVINYDSGMSNKVKYEYIPSQPTITSVSPNTGNRMGGDIVNIIGNDFETGLINIISPAIDDDPSEIDTIEMPMVKVANRTNKHLDREHDNAGVIDAFMAEVVIAPENMTFTYNAENENLNVQVLHRNETYRGSYTGVGSEPIFINSEDLKNDSGEGLPYEELIRVYLINDGGVDRFIVDAGYAPHTEFISSNIITATMPYYNRAEVVDLYVINPDGGEAKAQFEYKNPGSSPEIENIQRDGINPELQQRPEFDEDVKILRVNYKGGSQIKITGEDFRDPAIVEIGIIKGDLDPLPNPIIIRDGNYDLEVTDHEITFNMPAQSRDLVGTFHRVLVDNGDGGNAYSNRLSPPIYIEFIEGESSPEIDSVTPNLGPASGGTWVTIEGRDFRRTMEGFEGRDMSVLFGGNRVEYSSGDIIFESHSRIRVKVPAGDEIGEVEVKVENPDEEQSRPSGTFTYISKPRVRFVNPRELFRNDTETEVTITGEMFMPGATVVVGGELLEIDEDTDLPERGRGITSVDRNGENIEEKVVGGIEPAEVTVEDDYTIKVRFNETTEDLDNTNIIIINPDGGISDPYRRFDYMIPVPERPLDLEAIPGYESTMKLIWSKSPDNILNASDKFEVYARERSQASFIFLGETKDHEFLVRGLKPNTQYTFRVRALNEYGSAIDFTQVTERTLRVNEDHYLRDKQEEIERENEQQRRHGREEIVGDRVVRTIGVDELGFSIREFVIPLNEPKYENYNKFTIAIPVSLVRNNQRNIKVTDGQFDFIFNPSGLNVRQVLQVPSRDLDDAYVRVNIQRLTGSESADISTGIQRNQVQASQAYTIDFDLQAGRNISSISPNNLGGEIIFDFDQRAYSRANANRLFVGQYNSSQHRFNTVNNGSSGRINGSGTYMLLSNRQ